MKANREQIVEIAREWAPRRDKNGSLIPGTPYLHQGNTKGVGADCEGFVEGVFTEGGYGEVEGIVRNWRRHEDGSLMLQLLEDNLDFVTDKEVSQAQPGDIIAFSDEHLGGPRHLAIYSGQRGDGVHYVVHMGSKKFGVIEHRMGAKWLKQIHSIWAPRGIDG